MSKRIVVPDGHTAKLVPDGKDALLVPVDLKMRLAGLEAHCRNHTDLAACDDMKLGDIARLALLRGLAQLEAERDALANPEPETAPVVVVLGGRPWSYVDDNETVSLTEAGKAAAGE